LADVLGAERGELDTAHRHAQFHLIIEHHGHCRHHLVGASRQLAQHRGGLLHPGGLAQDTVPQHDCGVRREQRKRLVQPRQLALDDPQPAGLGFGQSDPPDEIIGRLSPLRTFVHIGPAYRVLAQQQQLEVDADLLQQLAAPGTARREIDAPLEPQGGSDGHGYDR
jgi:hypothetical protein